MRPVVRVHIALGAASHPITDPDTRWHEAGIAVEVVGLTGRVLGRVGREQGQEFVKQAERSQRALLVAL